MGCLFMEGEIGFCCLTTAVVYVSVLPTPACSSSAGKRGFHQILSISWPDIGADSFCFSVFFSSQNDLSQDQLYRWQSLLRPQFDASLSLESIERELQVKAIILTLTCLYSEFEVF